MKISIQQPEFFPWAGYFDKILQVDKLVVLDNVQYKKRYFENRNKLRTKEGDTWIRIPVLTKGKYKQNINEVKIDNSQQWQYKLWKTIEFNYHKAPYWSIFAIDLNHLIFQKWENLVDFNISIIKLFMRYLDIDKEIIYSSELQTQGSGSNLIYEICIKLGCNVYLSGKDGRNYMELSAFNEAGIDIKFQDFKHPVYKQRYGGFKPAMSILDLLFNHGLDSKNILTLANYK